MRTPNTCAVVFFVKDNGGSVHDKGRILAEKCPRYSEFAIAYFKSYFKNAGRILLTCGVRENVSHGVVRD